MEETTLSSLVFHLILRQKLQGAHNGLQPFYTLMTGSGNGGMKSTVSISQPRNALCVRNLNQVQAVWYL